MERFDMLKEQLKRKLFAVWMRRGESRWLNIPIRCRIPGGGEILAYGDQMGSRFFLQAYLGKPYEDGCQKLIVRLLKPGMTFFDVGANQGFYTLIAAKRVGDGGLVVAFEPVPSVMEKLRRNLAINGYRNVMTEQVAVSASEGSTEMHVCVEGFETLSSLREPAEDVLVKRELVRVPLVSLNEYVKRQQIGSIDLMKIDVEGGELDVLAGGSLLWERQRPIVICEVEDKRTGKWNYRASRIIDYLEERRYHWFEIGDGGTLSRKEHTEDHDLFSNYAAVPSEKLPAVSSLVLPP